MDILLEMKMKIKKTTQYSNVSVNILYENGPCRVEVKFWSTKHMEIHDSFSVESVFSSCLDGLKYQNK